MSTLRESEVHLLMLVHQARHRKLGWQKGRKIDLNPRFFIWKKPVQQLSRSTLEAKGWDALPAEMEVSLIRFYYENRDEK